MVYTAMSSIGLGDFATVKNLTVSDTLQCNNKLSVGSDCSFAGDVNATDVNTVGLTVSGESEFLNNVNIKNQIFKVEHTNSSEAKLIVDDNETLLNSNTTKTIGNLFQVQGPLFNEVRLFVDNSETVINNGLTVNGNVEIAASKKLTVDSVQLRDEVLAVAVAAPGVQIPSTCSDFLVGRRSGGAYTDYYILPPPQRGRIIYLTNHPETSSGHFRVHANVSTAGAPPYTVNSQPDIEIGIAGTTELVQFTCVSESTSSAHNNWVAFGISNTGAFVHLNS